MIARSERDDGSKKTSYRIAALEDQLACRTPAATSSFSFDHRRRPDTLRTAMATVLFWPPGARRFGAPGYRRSPFGFLFGFPNETGVACCRNTALYVIVDR